MERLTTPAAHPHPTFPASGTPLPAVMADLRRAAERMSGSFASAFPGKPDTVPHPVALAALATLSPVNPNNSGLHANPGATSAARSPSLWQPTRDMEAELVAMTGELLGAPGDAVGGYVVSGATEGNLAGLWMARNALRADPAAGRSGPTAVLAGRASHHSVRKACDVLGLGEGRWVRCRLCGRDHVFRPAANGSGLQLLGPSSAGHSAAESVAGLALDPEAVAAALHNLADRGVRRAIVVLTLGATVSGTVDPVGPVCAAARRAADQTGIRFAVHVDAAFGGLVLPFLAGSADRPDWRQWPEVASVTVDFHKMGRVPYGAGLLLFRRGWAAGVGRAVGYTTTGLDATLLGSRSGAAAAACWAVVRAVGFDGFARRARHGMLLAQRLTEQLTNAPGVVALPGSGVNLVPLRLPADPAAAAAVRAVLARHHIHGERLPLAAGRCPIEVYPTYLMPHVRRADVDRFAAELAAACQGTCPSIANR